MVEVKKNLANSSNYGSKRPDDISWIVIHYTANDGDSDEANGRYFHNRIVKASAHYFVDSDSITQSVPDNYVAWSVGGKFSTTGGAGKYYGKCTNTNSISVELCDDVKNGVIYPSEATINNAVDLVKSLMKKYNVDLDHVIRHYDVNGKKCPAYWVDNSKWESEFKSRFRDEIVNPFREPIATIKKGSKGEGAMWVQWELNRHGSSLVVDGDFGTKSHNALISFQKKAFPNDASQWDGKCGAKTKAKLKE